MARQFSSTDFVQIVEVNHGIPIALRAGTLMPVFTSCAVHGGPTRLPALWDALRQTVKEIDDTVLEGVLGPNAEEAAFLCELLDVAGAVPQVPHRRSNVGATRRMSQGAQIVPEFGCQQAFDGRPYQIHDGVQTARLILDRPLQLQQRRFNGTALRVAQYDHQARAELLGGKFDAADQGRRNDVSGDANDEQ